MLRQRIRARTSPLAKGVGRVLLVLISVGMIWYGLMLLLLALKVDHDAVDGLSGYRTAYDYLVALKPSDVSGQTRLIAGLSGLAAFLLLGYLALKEIPRPYLARSDLRVTDDDRGHVDVAPRAVERVAEAAAAGQEGVASASARYGSDDLTVNITGARAGQVAPALRAVQTAAREALAQHGLPQMPVNVTLTGFERTQRRELQ